MRANKLETALSRDRNIACLAPPDMGFFHVHVYKTALFLSLPTTCCILNNDCFGQICCVALPFSGSDCLCTQIACQCIYQCCCTKGGMCSLFCSALHEREQKEKSEANPDDDLFKERLAHDLYIHTCM